MASALDTNTLDTIVRQLRDRREREDLSLADLLALTELMVGSMQSFFSNVDTQLYRELRSIADFIEKTKGEVARLQPTDLKSRRIPRAGLELDAIVRQTEEATNTIMASAEKIMNADTSDPAGYQASVQDAVMQIFEACAFQDITGQRISKVVDTLKHIEERIGSISQAFGVVEEPGEASEEDEPDSPEEARRKALLLNGPQLAGEGVAQSDVDAFFNNSEEGEANQDAIDALFD